MDQELQDYYDKEISTLTEANKELEKRVDDLENNMENLRRILSLTFNGATNLLAKWEDEEYSNYHLGV